MHHTLSVEERLGRARGLAALIARTAGQAQLMSGSAPPPAFWSGLSEVADQLEEHIAAISKALDLDGKERRAPDVFVEK